MSDVWLKTLKMTVAPHYSSLLFSVPTYALALCLHIVKEKLQNFIEIFIIFSSFTLRLGTDPKGTNTLMTIQTNYNRVWNKPVITLRTPDTSVSAMIEKKRVRIISKKTGQSYVYELLIRRRLISSSLTQDETWWEFTNKNIGMENHIWLPCTKMYI